LTTKTVRFFQRITNAEFTKIDRLYARRILLWPLESSHVHKDESRIRYVGLGDCPNAVKLPWLEGNLFFVQFSTVFKKLFEVYGSTFLGALRYDAAAKLLSEYTHNALNQGFIRPKIMKKNVIKAVLRSKPIGLLEFLRSKGEINKKELQKEIQGIYAVTLDTLKQMMNGRFNE